MRINHITPRFIDSAPDTLEDGVLYVSERFGMALHNCCCGCGSQVVTPLTPADWQLQRRGDQVSLTPSIGNWNFACKSHYWIRNNGVVWEGQISQKQIEWVRQRDKTDKQRYHAQRNAERAPQSWLGRLMAWLLNRSR
jgi:hypothetical protein